MTLSLTNIFNESFFDEIKDPLFFDYSDLHIDDILDFFSKYALEPSLNYSAVLSAATTTIIDGDDTVLSDSDRYRRQPTTFSTNTLNLNALFCSAFNEALPSFKTSSARYI